jgi:endonuclease YncB( thermonuclease family)
VQAVGVDERLDIALADGRTLRLGGLDAPTRDRGAPQIAEAVRAFLNARLTGKEPTLVLFAAGADRWGRLIGDLQFTDRTMGLSRSTAAALLAAGYARVRPEFETRACAPERLAIEDGARGAGLGIWRDPDFAVIRSLDSELLRRRDGQFVVIEGTVRRVGFARSRIYLELAPRDGPTIVVARKLEPAFARTGHSLGALAGELIRVRGALDDRFGPRIEIGEPAMIETVERSYGSGEAEPHR